jgi:hypothetical protein
MLLEKNHQNVFYCTGVTVNGSVLLHTEDLSVFLLAETKGCPIALLRIEPGAFLTEDRSGSHLL